MGGRVMAGPQPQRRSPTANADTTIKESTRRAAASPRDSLEEIIVDVLVRMSYLQSKDILSNTKKFDLRKEKNDSFRLTDFSQIAFRNTA
jgi:hypothetical protein